jgi:hypothetical protein
MRMLWLLAACHSELVVEVRESEVPEPAVPLTLRPAVDDPAHQLSHAFLNGTGPLELVATAPRNSQLIVWATLHRHGELDPSYCLVQLHRFEGPAPVAIDLRFSWAPDPGNTRHTYRIAIAGREVAQEMRNPFLGLHAGAENMGRNAGPAELDTDYVLVSRLYDAQQAGGYHHIADGIASHDAALVIQARFVAPRELPVRIDRARCGFDR